MNSDLSKLLDCPFCGEPPTYIDYTGKNNTDNEKHFLECDCGIILSHFTKSKLFKQWNTRAI